jgi:hypothetical protein
VKGCVRGRCWPRQRKSHAAYRPLGVAAAIGLVLLLLGAAGAHLSKHDEFVDVAVPVALGGVAASYLLAPA